MKRGFCHLYICYLQVFTLMRTFEKKFKAQFTRSSVSWPVQSSMSCDFFLSWWAIQIGFNCLHKPFNSSTYSISRKRHTKIVW